MSLAASRHNFEIKVVLPQPVTPMTAINVSSGLHQKFRAESLNRDLRSPGLLMIFWWRRIYRYLFAYAYPRRHDEQAVGDDVSKNVDQKQVGSRGNLPAFFNCMLNRS
jgi:hypothetical protein